ncbi:MAG: riboflavin synthase [Candidatus Nanopelagicaceae bacterium]|nr:riboflavin synthase [Candidatus Nanopelagicaceae bacterium]
MFTGLVQGVGEVISISKSEDCALITFASDLAAELAVGDSISINGVCLTATDIKENTFTADVMVQTLKLTTLGSLVSGSKVNTELATRADARLGGHIVQGHVDGVAKVVVSEPGDKWQRFVVEIPASLRRYVVNQGSICVDGVSLTVGEIEDKTSRVTLWLIPETLAKTTLGLRKPGDFVNIEVDVLAKYVERLVQAQKLSPNSEIDNATGDEK